jgi:hypothetical protein
MMMRPISTIQLEHGLPILAELDLEPLLAAFASLDKLPIGEDGQFRLREVSFKPGDLAGFLPILKTLGKAGQGRLLRRLAAVAKATDDELLEAEADPAKLKALEAATARAGFQDSLVEVFGFFARAGLSASPSPGSSEGQAEQTGDTGGQAEPQAAGSPSGDS